MVKAVVIGPQTMKKVFEAHGIKNLYDLRIVFDAVEIALTTPSVQDAAKALLTPDEMGMRTAVFEACEGTVKVYKLDAVLRKLADG